VKVVRNVFTSILDTGSSGAATDVCGPAAKLVCEAATIKDKLSNTKLSEER